MSNVQSIRLAIVEALPITTSNYGEEPDRRVMYVPPAHIKALRLECNIVIGARGVGKSFWTAALGSSRLRTLLGASVKELESADVRIGFAVTPRINAYPDSAVFGQLLDANIPAYDIWRAVIVRWLAETLGEALPAEDWSTTVAWVRTNPALLARLAERANRKFEDDRRYGLVVFDALDRTSNNWQTMDQIVRDLLRVALWLKSFPRLTAKIFLREDQADRTVTNFPDASKLLATRAELTWARHDLHGLLWQMLCNASGNHGQTLRSIYGEVVKTPLHENDGVWQLAEEVKRESEAQRALFEKLAGKWMGNDPRRGVPYVWSVSHLADGRQRTSPRSFLAAIRAAAEDSLERYPDHPFTLHYESIRRGVQRASQIRVDEMVEDYPWVTELMKPLRGLTVPCPFDVIEDRWKEHFPGGLEDAAIVSKRLPPQHIAQGWDGVCNDLERIGIFEKMRDKRINMPDLYRIGFGLGRRGGVKPIRQF